MKFASFFFTFIFILSFSVILPITLYAELSGQLGADVTLSLTPENPKANQSVTATITSYSTNLDNATITWTLNGKVKKTGIGAKTFTFTTGGNSLNTNITADISTAEGQNITKIFNIKPVSVDLLWQVVGYTPPFYKGKTLFSHQDKIQFVAIPHMTDDGGREIFPRDLVYTWTRNGTIAGEFSGYGKNTYTVLASVISRPLAVSVEVTSGATGGVGQASVTASPTDPILLFYEKDPLYGIQFQRALIGGVNMNSSREIEVVAEPFFFGVSTPTNDDLSYTWKINGAPIDGDKTATARVFRQKEDTSGTSLISLSIENGSKILQFAQNSFNLNFGNK